MRNFDIIKGIAGLGTIYRYCAAAEDFQINNSIVGKSSLKL